MFSPGIEQIQLRLTFANGAFVEYPNGSYELDVLAAATVSDVDPRRDLPPIPEGRRGLMIGLANTYCPWYRRSRKVWTVRVPDCTAGSVCGRSNTRTVRGDGYSDTLSGYHTDLRHKLLGSFTLESA